MGLCFILEINGAYPSGSFFIASIQYADITIFCTSVDKRIAPA
jgi:hypothetical protein